MLPPFVHAPNPARRSLAVSFRLFVHIQKAFNLFLVYCPVRSAVRESDMFAYAVGGQLLSVLGQFFFDLAEEVDCFYWGEVVYVYVG